MKYAFIICFAISILLEVRAQDRRIEKADKYFVEYSYSKAIPLYKKSFKGSPNIETAQKIAQSYYKLNQMDSSEVWYKRVIDLGSTKAEDIFYYSEILKMNQKYADSDQWLTKFRQMKASDSRPERKLKDQNYVEELQKNKSAYEIKNLEINSNEADFSAIYFKNQVVFVSSRTKVGPIKRDYNWDEHPFLDIYVADPSNEGDLSNVNLFNSNVKSKYHDGPVTFDSTYKEMYFTRNYYLQRKDKEKINQLKILYRSFQQGQWTEEKEFSYNNESYSVGHPFLFSDGKSLFFVSDMPGGFGGTDIYVCKKQSDGTWSSPINLGSKVNTEGNEMFPFVQKDKTLFFASNGHMSLGGLDVFSSLYNESASEYQAPVNLGFPISSPFDDFAYVIDQEDKKGYFSSNRIGGKGDDDIYSFKKNKVSINICGLAKDKGSYQIISQAKVTLFDAQGNVVQEILSDDQGKYCFEVEDGLNYRIVGEKEGYTYGESTFLIKKEDLFTPSYDVLLAKPIHAVLLVKDKKTGEVIPNVSVKIIDNFINAPFLDSITPISGSIRKLAPGKKIGDRLSYHIDLKKEGYMGKSLVFNHLIDKDGDVLIHEFLDVNMDKLEIGTDIGKLVNINPIYFDLNKWDIRPDAAAELDKIVRVMNEYPNIVIELGSHTDSRGSDSYNLNLSDKRAKSSAKYIVSKGIDSSRIYGKGYGETKLVNSCKNNTPCSEEEHQQNRRTEFKIVKM